MTPPPPDPQSLTDASDLPNLDVLPDHQARCPLIDSWHWD
jgi:hypothetical protein